MSDNLTNARIAAGVEDLVKLCYGRSLERGWWDVPEWFHAAPINVPIFEQYVRVMTPTKLALVHSEVSEALEGDRKNSMDDHLPRRSMLEVELADAVIRICDLAGARGLDLGGAIIEKLEYNAKRADHNRENRAAAGGKTY